MLIETPYKEGDTVSMKLSSGEEVIARLEKETDTTITIYKPLMVVGSPQGLALAPFMFTTSQDAKFKISMTNVLCIVKTEDDMAKQYIQNISGIAVA
jgi:hypothetical protein